MKRDILVTVKSDLSDLQKGFRDEVTYIFDRGELLVEKVDCTAEKQLLDIAYIGNPAKDGVADTSVPDFIIRLLKKTPKCLSMAGPPEDYKPQRWEYPRVYEIAKCEALSSVDEHTPVDRIVGVYIDLKASSLKEFGAS